MKLNEIKPEFEIKLNSEDIFIVRSILSLLMIKTNRDDALEIMRSN